MEPLLLFANRHDVRLMSLYSRNFKEVVHHLHSAIAVDYDYRGRKLFWSDVGSEKIFWSAQFFQLLNTFLPVHCCAYAQILYCTMWLMSLVAWSCHCGRMAGLMDC